MTTHHHRTADILVIGAGVMGASIAWHLAGRKAGRVLVVDKGRVGQGQSGRSSGLIRLHYTFPPEVRLALCSLETFRQWREVVGRPGDFRVTGLVRLVAPQDTQALIANVEMQRSLGVNTCLISSAELHDMEPEWSLDGVDAAAYEADSGYSDGAAVAQDLLDRGRELGAQYSPNTRVTTLRVERGHLLGVETDRGAIDAPRVIVATGPWTAPLLSTVGFETPIENIYHEVVLLQHAEAPRGRNCACIDSGVGVYFRPDAPGLTLLGAFEGHGGADPDDFPQSASQDSLAELVAAAVRRVPALADAGIARSITGIYDLTPDGRPLLGAVPGVEGLYMAAGFSGMGFKIAPAVGLTMAELLTEGRATTVDISAFRPSRFAEGKPIQARHEYTVHRPH
jgi:sarcosine oxidase subunit beta